MRLETIERFLPDCSCSQSVGQISGLFNVLRENGRSQSIFAIVGTIGDLLQGLELLDGKHWAEDLLSADGHGVGHVGEYGGLKHQMYFQRTLTYFVRGNITVRLSSGGFGHTSKCVYNFNSTKQLNPNLSNRRSAVQ